MSNITLNKKKIETNDKNTSKFYAKKSCFWCNLI